MPAGPRGSDSPWPRRPVNTPEGRQPRRATGWTNHHENLPHALGDFGSRALRPPRYGLQLCASFRAARLRTLLSRVTVLSRFGPEPTYLDSHKSL